MSIRINAGFTITDSVHVGDSEFVLGVNSGRFVTWKCKDKTDYFWGHYFGNELEAVKDLLARAGEEVRFLEQSMEGTSFMTIRPMKESERDYCYTISFSYEELDAVYVALSCYENAIRKERENGRTDRPERTKQVLTAIGAASEKISDRRYPRRPDERKD